MRWNEYRNKILAEINAAEYYDSVLTNVTRRGNEIKATCPFKEKHTHGKDNNPSFTANVDTGVYHCVSCGSKGNVHTLSKYMMKLTSEDAWLMLGDGLGIPRPDNTKAARPDLDPGLAVFYHEKLMQLTGPIRTMLEERRGLTNETLKRFLVGWDDERLTVPVYNQYNELVNIRRYKWNPGELEGKVTNYVDEFKNSYGEVRIFNIEALIDDSIKEVIWCEGEFDAITAEQYGYHAATPTAGAGAWKNQWSTYFRNKDKVYIAQDNDEAGRMAALKYANIISEYAEVYIVEWPEDFPEKGDITDFFTKCGLTKSDMDNLLKVAKKYEVEEPTAASDKALTVNLADSAKAEFYKKRLKVPVMVSGKDSTPFICPKKLKVECYRMDDSNKCASCPVSKMAGHIEKTLTAADDVVLKMINVSDKKQYAVLMEEIGIPKTCNSCNIKVEEYMNIEELRLIPKADETASFATEHDYVVRTGYYIGDSLKANKRYTMAGYMYPDPNTQQATYLFDNAFAEKDRISDFELNEETLEHLRLFQLSKGQSIEDKFNEIHTDLERNVTYIWERRDVGYIVDLIYHTVLNFYFQEQFVKRGWGEALIIGDSGQAKTTVVERLMEHYRLGEMHSGESSRRTGLVYNMQQNNKRWFLVWGAFPLNDGGLITLDELSGLAEEDLAIMSDVRSSGVAKATGVITAETNSRTRAIYISNPRNGRQLNSETYGVSAILKLFGKAEDVRRLDVAAALASGDVAATLINKSISDLPPVTHKYTSDACNSRVLWAWSRRPEHIVISKETTKCILSKAIEMGEKYSSKVPLVEAADQRIKIARLAVAAACCTVSTDKDFEKVLVKPAHVEFVCDFLNKLYSSKSMGYDKMSSQSALTSDTSKEKIAELRKAYLSLPLIDLKGIIKVLYDLSFFDKRTLEDYTGCEPDEMRSLLKFLTTNYIVEKSKYTYKKLPLGTALWQDLVNNTPSDKEIKEAKDTMEY